MHSDTIDEPDSFTLRGRAKVNVQWKLFCTVHNMEKTARKVEILHPPQNRRMDLGEGGQTHRGGIETGPKCTRWTVPMS